MTMTNTEKYVIVTDIKNKIYAAIDSHKHNKNHPFSWITDVVCHEPWGYYIHVAWVEDWNKQDRISSDEDFLRFWIANDENILKALALKESYECLTTR